MSVLHLRLWHEQALYEFECFLGREYFGFLDEFILLDRLKVQDVVHEVE